MNEKIRETLNHKMVQAFLKSFFILGLVAAGLYAAHVVLGALFWSPELFGFLLVTAVGWGTYINYTYEVPFVERRSSPRVTIREIGGECPDDG